jgi:hypothetical protein
VHVALIGVALLATTKIGAARAFQEGGEQGGGDAAEKSGDGDSEKDDGPEHFFAVVGGDVYTGTGAILRGATVLARNGKIKAIGYDLDLPPDTKTLDVTGLRVYPGLVAISSRGLLGNATSDFEDTLDPFNSRMVLGLASGITTTGTGNSAVKLKRFSVKDAVVNDKIFSPLAWSGRNPPGKRTLREKFVTASEYLRKYRDWEQKVKKEKELKEPSKKGVDVTVLAVLRGEAKAKFNSAARDDLLGIARLAQEFGFRPVIEDCQEGWTIADELGRAGASVVLTPRARLPKREDLTRPGGSSIENAAILHKAGVPIAVVPATESVDLGGIVGRDIMAIAIEAGFAVRGGLSEEAALASITMVPARILGVSHRVGSLEVGKDCDLIVTDGDVLHYETFVQYAVIDGKQVYDKEQELFFAHIRPRAPNEAPEKKLDKGESEVKPTEAKPEETDGEKTDEKTEEKKVDEPEKDKKEEKKDGGDSNDDDGGSDESGSTDEGSTDGS